ncbi:MAG: UDP-N-acetylmuramoyl-L-alanyl-D-glutamate--2,6-diaminopimelate ligase, partial [Streptomycetaceae bacterium]|nr:UDP-N-acetylmuramoyl-L-alanyl-D-glutamate--2,6-diaminopimelate ligase [Streptomycetaceae bacterium]
MSDDLTPATRPRHPRRTALTEVVAWLEAAAGAVDVRGDVAGVDVTGLSLATQRVRPGDLYAALPGARAHGADFGAA